MRFNAPPGWSVPSPDWLPDAGWTPDPSWPPAPPGWEFFVADAESADATIPSVDEYPRLSMDPAPRSGRPAPHGGIVIFAAAAAVIVLALLGVFLFRLVASKTDGSVSRASSDTTMESAGPKDITSDQDPVTVSDGSGAINFETMQNFVYRHYADLPADPRASWDRLDSQFTARLTWSDYASFWATIQSVSVTSVRPDGPDSVIARLTLVPHRGNTSTELRRIKFVSTGGVLQIHESDRLE